MQKPTYAASDLVATFFTTLLLTGLAGVLLLGGWTTAAIADQEISPHASTEAPTITPLELQTLRTNGEAPVVIDVRTASEFASGHIPEAVNIPFDEVASRISEVDAPNGVALYCMMGPRARKGEAALLEAGYASVLHLEGGLAAWKSADLPVEIE